MDQFLKEIPHIIIPMFLVSCTLIPIVEKQKWRVKYSKVRPHKKSSIKRVLIDFITQMLFIFITIFIFDLIGHEALDLIGLGSAIGMTNSFATTFPRIYKQS